MATLRQALERLGLGPTEPLCVLRVALGRRLVGAPTPWAALGEDTRIVTVSPGGGDVGAEHHAVMVAGSRGAVVTYGDLLGGGISALPPDPLYHQRFFPDEPLPGRGPSLDGTTVDRLCREEGPEAPDVLEVDAGGAELDVLTGASWVISRAVLAIRVVVGLTPSRRGEPPMAELDGWLRKRGFVLVDLAPRRALRAGERAPGARGQATWAEGWYLRDPAGGGASPATERVGRVRLALIADAAGWPGFARELLGGVPGWTGEDSTGDPVGAGAATPAAFASARWQGLNQARLEHLDRLGLPLAHHTVLEVGAGVGDLTSFFLTRACDVTVTDGRPELVAHLRRRFPGVAAGLLDLEAPPPADTLYDVVFCYGVFYHLQHPAEALRALSDRCLELLLLETCLHPDDSAPLLATTEDVDSGYGALRGRGCFPSRAWVLAELARHFPWVYEPVDPPTHPEFAAERPPGSPRRGVFIACRRRLDLATLREVAG